jgi:hypothetical protein
VEPVLKLTHSCGESVTSAEGGVVGNQVIGKDDFVFSVYCRVK